MRPLYQEIDSQLEVYTKRNTTFPLHLHKYMECIYVMEGTIRLGVGKEWFEMNPHDFAVIFPDMIHRFYVDENVFSRGIYVLGTSALAGSFAGILQKYYPRTPVIPRDMVHADITYALDTLLRSDKDPYYFDMQQAYFQILLARTLPVCDLIEKKGLEISDLAGQAVSYISRHFREDVSLAGMARELGISPYVLSRIFSGMLKTNFNQYLNEIRLDYASHLLHTTEKSITDILMDSGFNSQTTFNRVFREKYHMSPRDYRMQSQHKSDQIRQQLSAAGQVQRKAADDPAEMPWKPIKGRFL